MFGEAAVRLGHFAADQLADLLARQQEDPRALADGLIARGHLEAQEADALLAAHAAAGPDYRRPPAATCTATAAAA